MATCTCTCGWAIALGLLLVILDVGFLVSHVDSGSQNEGFDIGTIILCIIGDVAVVAAVTARTERAILAAVSLRTTGVLVTLGWRIQGGQFNEKNV